MTAHAFFAADVTGVRRSDLRRRLRRAAAFGLLPRLRTRRLPMRPSAGSVVFG